MSIISGNLADGKPMQVGGWYNAMQWDGSKLGAPNQITVGNSAGQQVSSEVRSQSAAQQGVSLQNFDQYIQAQQLQSGATPSYTTGATNNYVSGLNGEVDKARKAMEDTLNRQKTENDARLETLRAKEKDTLGQIDTATTPFRADLETAERERLHINTNFEENQKLTDELDTLLTEGNNLIKQQQGVTGLAAVRNPRIQKTMDDVAGRVGVIQAVMNARNGQISQAYSLIDRSVEAITNDRKDRISYYETVLNLNNRDIVSLDEDNKKVASEQLDLLKGDLTRAQSTADYVKQLMINPATAQLMGQAGVSLNDSVDTINKKLQQAQYMNEVRDMNNKMATSGYVSVYDPGSVSKDKLITVTDSYGKKYYYRKETTGSGTAFDTSTFIKDIKGLQDTTTKTDSKEC
jgi:sulfur transfer complex TusBCD TusB component (DsrH family)